MKLKTFFILILLALSSLAFSKVGEEKSVTFIVTGNVRAEPNLCG